MPICAIKNDTYIDFLSNKELEVDKLNFIKELIKNNKIIIKDIDLKIYVIHEYIMPTYDRAFIAYNYCINGISNYLTYYKQPVKNDFIIKKKLLSREYFQELLWSGEDE
ncbi:MAG: hypothetical protein E7174_02220 [Firmicutes bacterium]|nr:hypothetical protein [Bacillota bacterium]